MKELFITSSYSIVFYFINHVVVMGFRVNYSLNAKAEYSKCLTKFML